MFCTSYMPFLCFVCRPKKKLLIGTKGQSRNLNKNLPVLTQDFKNCTFYYSRSMFSLYIILSFEQLFKYKTKASSWVIFFLFFFSFLVYILQTNFLKMYFLWQPLALYNLFLIFFWWHLLVATDKQHCRNLSLWFALAETPLALNIDILGMPLSFQTMFLLVSY